MRSNVIAFAVVAFAFLVRLKSWEGKMLRPSLQSPLSNFAKLLDRATVCDLIAHLGNLFVFWRL